MDKSRWRCLTVAALYFPGCVILVGLSGDSGPDATLGFSVIFFLIGLPTVWWAEALSDMLWGGVGTVDHQTAPEGMYRFLGWIFITISLALFVVALCRL